MKDCLNINVNSNNSSLEICLGSFHILYLDHTERDAQKEVYDSISKKYKTALIHAPLKEAVKVPAYYERFIRNVDNTELIEKYDLILLDEFSFLSKLVFTLARESLRNEVLIVEPAGLSYSSVYKLAHFCYNKLTIQNGNTVILMMFENKVPPFRFERIDSVSFLNFANWCNGDKS